MCIWCSHSYFLFLIQHQHGFEEALAQLPNKQAFMGTATYLQENKSLPVALDKFTAVDEGRLNEYFNIILFRLWEMLLVNPQQGQFEFIESYYSPSKIESLLTGFDQRIHPLLKPLFSYATYKDTKVWLKFEHSEQLFKICENYILGYLNQDLDESTLKLEKNQDYEQYINSTFPCLYFSMLYLAKYDSKSDLIKRIAKKQHVTSMPTWFGYEIWIRRKALSICLKQHGLQFILDSESIELDYIIYLVAKFNFNDFEIQRIKNNIKSSDRRFFIEDVESILHDMRTFVRNW
jgi:hypothetical protein